MTTPPHHKRRVSRNVVAGEIAKMTSSMNAVEKQKDNPPKKSSVSWDLSFILADVPSGLAKLYDARSAL